MPADQSRLLFLQLVALEKDFLFGQNDKQIYVNIGNSQQSVKITAEGKRARWEKIGQQMVQAGGIHYLGKSYDELRMIYYDLRRRTTEKLKKIGEKEGEEGAKKNLKLNERDLVVLEIIGKNSLGPVVRENLNLNEEMSTSRMANSPPNSFATAGEQSSIMKNETGIEEEEMGRQFERWMEEGGGIMGENGGMEGEEEEEGGMVGKRIGNAGRKRKRRRGEEEEEGEGERMGMMNSGEQFEMLVGQAKLNYFNSQINLAESKRRLCEEQRALAKAQRTESELRAELLRMDIQRARVNNAQKATNNQK